MANRNTLGLYDPIVIVHPLLGFGGIDKGESQSPDAELRRKLDRLAVGGMTMLLSDINWTVTSIAIILIVCWVLAEFIEGFENRKQMRQRYT